MKFLVFFVVLGAVAALSNAEHVHHHQRRGVEEKTAAITNQEQNLDPEGNFQYSYDTANGISARALGSPKPVGEEKPVVIEGTYSYTSPEGKTVNVKYTADENGYRPSVQL